jgi:hypothetical protein
MHPDKGGSASAFAALAEAFAVLTDAGRRRSYDEGEDLPKLSSPDQVSLRVEVEKRYFPHKAGFRLFGDPLEKRRQEKEHQQRIDAVRVCTRLSCISNYVCSLNCNYEPKALSPASSRNSGGGTVRRGVVLVTWRC